MRTKKRRALTTAIALFSALPLVAHHSVTAEFNPDKTITLKGVITKVDWVNPHIAVYMDVKDDEGKVTTWKLQSLPPLFFRGSGMTKATLLNGAEATVLAYPAKDGTQAYGYMLKVTYPDGHFYNLGGNNAPAPPPGAGK